MPHYSMYSFYLLPQHKFMLTHLLNIPLCNIFKFLRFILKVFEDLPSKRNCLHFYNTYLLHTLVHKCFIP